MVLSFARGLLKVALWVLFSLVLVGFGLYLWFLRSGPTPQPWHSVPLADFTAADAGAFETLEDYRRLEDRLFADLQRVYLAQDTAQQAFNRYRHGSRSDPQAWPTNWNRSFHLPAAAGTAPRGNALLLHGLTDSPYSLRSIADHLAASGIAVTALRLPGHGTAPSGLLSFTVEDMRAAVQLAVRDLRRRSPAGRPLYLVGYSNGAALAVDYTLESLESGDGLEPDGLVLLSPAIAISKFAVVGRLKTGLSSIPGFERAAWENIALEVDPYKYSSFSFHAAGETFRLTRGLAQRIERLGGDGLIEGFPPTLVFLSTVDSTVQAEPVVSTLLARLAPGRHELVLFDVNRFSDIQQLLVEDPGALTQRLRAEPARPYALTIVTNVAPDSLQVQEERLAAGATGAASLRPLGLEWPPRVFSLSHVALSFAPDDALYGYASPATPGRVQLGQVAVHGENGVLRVPNWLLTRQRSNPFHSYVLERIDGFLTDSEAARPTPRAQ